MQDRFGDRVERKIGTLAVVGNVHWELDRLTRREGLDPVGLLYLPPPGLRFLEDMWSDPRRSSFAGQGRASRSGGTHLDAGDGADDRGELLVDAGWQIDRAAHPRDPTAPQLRDRSHDRHAPQVAVERPLREE